MHESLCKTFRITKRMQRIQMPVVMISVRCKVIRNYRRREAKQRHLSLDEIQLADDGGLSELLNDSLLDLLTEDDKALITAYYSTEFANKQEVADRFGMTLPALYTAVHRIKKELRNMINLNK